MAGFYLNCIDENNEFYYSTQSNIDEHRIDINGGTCQIPISECQENPGQPQCNELFLYMNDVFGAKEPDTIYLAETLSGSDCNLNVEWAEFIECLTSNNLLVSQATVDFKWSISNSDISNVISNHRTGTINVLKTVINDNGGTKSFLDFPLFVDNKRVISGQALDFPAPAPVYTVTESHSLDYVHSFSGDCDLSGQLNLVPGQNKLCVIINNDTGIPVNAPPVPPLIDLLITPDKLSLPEGPGLIEYTYTIKNVGKVSIEDITINDDTCKDINFISGDLDNDSKLDLDEIWLYRCKVILSETHTSHSVVTGWANGQSNTDIENSRIIVGASLVSPLIHIWVNPSALGSQYSLGSHVHVFTVTNPGNVPLGTVRVTDNECKISSKYSGDDDNDSMLDPSETWIYTCEMNEVPASHIHIAKAVGYANDLVATDIASAPHIFSTKRDLDRSVISAEAQATLHRSLKFGSTGNDVVVLQVFLEKKGMLHIPPGVHKGYYGNLTRKAVSKYQLSVGLPAVGIMGPLTRAKIISDLSR